MADSRRYGLNQPIAIGQILAEAQHRWLRPGEICEILRNHQRFRLTSDPPYKPLGGSLFLFDRKTLRYFRKDGHNWRKKKDGKTVREAHEKLKAGSVDVLHCYYAHGEENENFQRRSYWMLDGQLQHIVLVHYREVNEGSRSGIPRLLNADGGMQNDSGSASTSLVHTSSAQVNSPVLAAHASYASSPSTAHWNGQAPSSEFDDGDSGDDFGVSSLGEPTTAGFGVGTLHPTDTAEKNTVGCTGPVHLPCESRGLNDLIGLKDGPSNPFYMNQVDHSNLISDSVLQTDYGVSREAGLLGGISFGLATSSSTWPEAHSSNKDRTTIRVQRIGHAPVYEKSPELTLDPYNINKHGLDGERGAFSDAHLQLLRRNTPESIEERRKEVNAVTAGFPSDNSMINDLPKIYESTEKQNFYSVNSLKENNIGSLMNVTANDSSLDLLTEDGQAQKNDPKSSVCNGERQEELKKLDSFGRWMNREIGRDCDDSLMTSDSPLYWCSLDSESNKDVSSLSSHMQLDADSLGPSLSKDQLFSITDFSPDWAFSGEESKVLISGTFMKNLKQYPPNMKWSCMFGEVEVPAEVLTTNALRCRAPAHVPGLVPLYITCSNRLACSEVREFEFREKVSGLGLSNAVKIESEEELQLQIRFAKMLFLGVDRMQRIGCSKGKCDKCLLMVSMFSESPENEWHQIGRASQQNPREALIQRLLKDRLFDWLLHKIHEEGKGPNVLDERGQGVIHLAAALGYEWAMRPIVAAGVSPSFRDARGRTGLHWAAYFGREETVVTLVGLGAAPGAVEDPTSKFPEGQTAADLASSRGHKGIAGYLAEADLTSHLSALTLKQSGLDSVSGNPDLAEDSIQTEEQTISPFEGIKEQQLSLRESLAAVRNSAQAAARIQAAFRVHSFIQRQSTQASDDHSEVSNELIALAYWNKSQKVGHFSDSLHAAAVRIQQKFRGWKGRKEFLKIRHRIVKIQAHVRGHQVRKQYKKVVWSVSIVEKAILRWRRKGTGLRGFRVDKAIGHLGPESGKTDEYDFLRAGRKKKEAGVEKALARVQSMVRYPEARDQYMRLVQKAKTREGAAA